MNTTFKKELPVLALVALPFIYLAFLWNQLPDSVPLHWNASGEIDRYGSKSTLLILPMLLPLFVYSLFLIIPRLDPKKKIEQMGNKYQSIKIIMVAITSVLSIYILYAVKQESSSNLNLVLALIGIIFMVLGNFSKTFKQNYFMGLRTPWTLESEEVWKSTHKLAGVIWLLGGLLILVLSMVLPSNMNIILFLSIVVAMVLIPTIYSYVLYKRIKASS